MATAKKTAPKIEAFDAAKLTEGAREYVSRATVSAKEQTETAYESAQKFNAGLEKTLSRALTGYVSALSDIAEATRANMIQVIEAAEKAAQAKTLAEAAQIQAEAARELATANYERFRAAFAQTRDAMTESVEAVREGVAEFAPVMKKAA